MAEHQQSDNRPRRQGGQNRRNNNNRRNGDDRPRTEHETYRRSGEATDYTPPSEQRKTFGGGEYERVYRDKPTPKTGSLGQRILKIISFGLLGGDKPAAKPSAAKSASGNRERQERSRSGGQERRGNDRPRQRTERNGEKRNSSANRRSENGELSSAPREPREARPKVERAPQPVNIDDITTPRLHVGNLSYDTAESDLFELFSGIGKVTNAEIVTHSRTQRSKGFGFVQLTSVEDAKRAAQDLHGKPFMGRNIMVGPAKGNRPEGDRESSNRSDERSEEAHAD